LAIKLSSNRLPFTLQDIMARQANSPVSRCTFAVMLFAHWHAPEQLVEKILKEDNVISRLLRVWRLNRHQCGDAFAIRSDGKVSVIRATDPLLGPRPRLLSDT